MITSPSARTTTRSATSATSSTSWVATYDAVSAGAEEAEVVGQMLFGGVIETAGRFVEQQEGRLGGEHDRQDNARRWPSERSFGCRRRRYSGPGTQELHVTSRRRVQPPGQPAGTRPERLGDKAGPRGSWGTSPTSLITSGDTEGRR